MPKPSDLIPDALKSMIDPATLASMDAEAVEAEKKQKLRDELLINLVSTHGMNDENIKILKTKLGIV